MVGENLVADRVHEMRLAEPHAAVNKERIVRGEARRVGDCLCHRVGELVGASRDEGVEGVLRIERCRVIGRSGVCVARRRRQRETALRRRVGALLRLFFCRCGLRPQYGLLCRFRLLCIDHETDRVVCAERLVHCIAEEGEIARLNVLLCERVSDREDEFAIFQCDGHDAGDPLIYGVLWQNAVRLCEDLLPQGVEREILFYGHGGASLQKNFYVCRYFPYPQCYSQMWITLSAKKRRYCVREQNCTRFFHRFSTMHREYFSKKKTTYQQGLLVHPPKKTRK